MGDRPALPGATRDYRDLYKAGWVALWLLILQALSGAAVVFTNIQLILPVARDLRMRLFHGSELPLHARRPSLEEEEGHPADRRSGGDPSLIRKGMDFTRLCGILNKENRIGSLVKILQGRVEFPTGGVGGKAASARDPRLRWIR